MYHNYCGETGNKTSMGEPEPSLSSLVEHSRRHAPSHIIMETHAHGGHSGHEKKHKRHSRHERRHHADGGHSNPNINPHIPHHMQGGAIAPTYKKGGHAHSKGRQHHDMGGLISDVAGAALPHLIEAAPDLLGSLFKKGGHARRRGR